MLSSILPAPKQKYSVLVEEEEVPIIRNVVKPQSSKIIPPYPHRKGFIPLDPSDFNDGGAYPEIHVVQYPLNMGKPGSKNTSIVAVDVDNKGNVRYDAIVKQGSNKNKIVQSTIDDIKEKAADDSALRLPSQKEEDDTAEATRKALESLLQGKITLSKPTSVTQSHDAEPEYIRYTPNPNAPGFNPATQQRIIKMVEAQVDPLEPSKHEFKKAPRGSSSPPVPILHSPPRKLTVADQQAWKVPPCISNWKNSKGFIIPLDKRLAADGRGLQEVTINNKFATLSEALYVAERKASEDLRVRNQIRRKMAVQEKEDREKELREMAAKARVERSGVFPDFPASTTQVQAQQQSYASDSEGDDGDQSSHYKPRPGSSRPDSLAPGPSSSSRRREEEHDEYKSTGQGGSGRRDRDRESIGSGSSDEERDDDDRDDRRHGESDRDKQARLQREKMRVEKRKERERELRLDNMKGNMRKNKVDRDEGRDISEKIALGMHKASGKLTGEAMFDSRLFNQSAGLSSGFGADDEYSTFTKPLFERGEASSIYRPKKADGDIYGDADAQMSKLTDTSRFKPDTGFKGADSGAGAGPRDAPVQFERSRGHDAEDQFGISDIVKSKKSRHH